MKAIGTILIAGVLLWLFIVTLPFIWWIWLLLVGFIFVALAKDKKKD